MAGGAAEDEDEEEEEDDEEEDEEEEEDPMWSLLPRLPPTPPSPRLSPYPSRAQMASSVKVLECGDGTARSGR